MERRTPLTRRAPLSQGEPLARRTPLTARGGLTSRAVLTRTGRMRQRSPQHAEQMAVYRLLAAAFLREHPRCQFPGCVRASLDVHHRKGRVGTLLLDTRHWSALCRTHHDWAGQHPTAAVEMGISERRLGTTPKGGPR
jgi:hypothetical protein